MVITQKGVEISGSADLKDLWGPVSLAQKHIRPNSASYMRKEAKLHQPCNNLVFIRLLQAIARHRIYQENLSPKKAPSSTNQAI